MTYIANWLESHSSINFICVRISLSNFVERYINQNHSRKRDLANSSYFPYTVLKEAFLTSIVTLRSMHTSLDGRFG